MKKLFLLILALGIIIGSISANTQSEGVYVCNGPKSTTYHKYSNCRGLNKCSTSIKKVSKKEAEAMKRTACKICYK